MQGMPAPRHVGLPVPPLPRRQTVSQSEMAAPAFGWPFLCRPKRRHAEHAVLLASSRRNNAGLPMVANRAPVSL